MVPMRDPRLIETSMNLALASSRIVRLSRQRLECAAFPRFGLLLVHGPNACANGERSLSMNHLVLPHPLPHAHPQSAATCSTKTLALTKVIIQARL